MEETNNRRPLASRNTRWAHALTELLARTPITPNQVSQASMVAALIAGILFAVSASLDGGARITLLLLAAVFCQLRLICNLLDGMLAVEAGLQSRDGAFWNEWPDRFSDICILVGCGMAAGTPMLGWVASTFALYTAYTRELGNAAGAGGDFSGPMAKPQRMAVVTIAAVISCAEPLMSSLFAGARWHGTVLYGALIIIIVGSVLTVLLRSSRMLAVLRTQDHRD